jgi:hypothetical protein
MVAQALNLGILTLMFFIAGMIKPKWPLFFMEKPSRFLILVISTILFMITATMYGEGHRQNKREQASKETAIQTQAPIPVPVPQAAPTATPQPSAPQKTAP